MVQPGAPGLPGTYKIGLWYDTGSFPDQRFGTDGLSLANPASNGNPAMHHGNYSFYGVADQTIWQSAQNSSRGLNAFARIIGAPDAQNLIDFSFNGGLTLTAPLPGRDNDQAGIDFGLGRVSQRASDLDHDTAAFSGSATPIRGSEEMLEFTYQAQATPWLVLQPDLQYIFNPGAGILDPNDPARNLRNELVVGIRATTTF
jgi:porin